MADRTGREPVDARVDANDLRTALHEVDDGMAEQAVAVGGERHLAPHDHDLGNLVHGVVIRALEAACIVHLGIVGAEHVRTAHRTRLVAGITGLRVAGVRRAEHGLGKVGNQDAAGTAGAGQDGDALDAIIGFHLVTPVLDGGECLVPRDALPLVGQATVFLRALHRVDDAAGVVHVVLQSGAPGAQTTLGDGVVLVALDVVDLAIGIHVDLKAAAYRVAPGGRPHGSADDGKPILLIFPRLSKIVLEFHTAPSSSRLLQNAKQHFKL